MKLAKSPLASQLAQQEGQHDLFRQVVATTRTALGRLAQRHQVTIR